MSTLFDHTYLVVRYFPYFLMVLFLFIALFGGKEHRPHSALLFLLFLLHLITFNKITFDINSPEYLAEYISNNHQKMRLNGCVAMAMCMFVLKDKKAKIISLLLCCALFIHFMLIYDLKEESSWLSNFIYDYCDELIITVWLTIMVISRDGLIKSFIGAPLLLRGLYVHSIRSLQNKLSRKKEKESST